jgi:hypothetical protein
MCTFAWPRAFETVTTCTPAASRLLAKECRRSWKRTWRVPALRSVGCRPVRKRSELLEGAVALLEEGLQRILDGLDEFSLRRALSDRYHGAPSGEARP